MSAFNKESNTSAESSEVKPETKKREYKDFGHEQPEAGPSTRAVVDMDTIELKAEDLYDKAKVDLETVFIDDVFKQHDQNGLTDDEAHRRLELFGPNKLEVEKQNAFLQFLSFMWNPLSWMMEVAAFVAIVLSNGQHKAPNWPVFVGIVLLLFINSLIGFYRERKAGNAIKSIMDSLVPKTKVKRDGNWSEIESSGLVPGDIISFKIGDIVPADCRLTEAIDVSVALTSESPPESKKSGDQCFSGFTCRQGEAKGVVTSTGPNTFFGRAASLVGQDDDTTFHLHKIAQIGSFCLVTIGTFVLAEIVVLYAIYHYDYRRGLNNILVLLIGGIPLAMPTALSVTLAVGAQKLANYKAIVTRITAIEQLASVTTLCSNKTGTLTTNKLTITRSNIQTYGPFPAEAVILLAAYASRTENQDAIDISVVRAIGDPARARAGIRVLDFKPFNHVNKRTEITYREDTTGKLKRVTKGMTGVITELCTRNKTDEIKNRLEMDVEDYAMRGLRTLAVAYEEIEGDDFKAEGNGFELIGLLAIYDHLREDSTKQTIDEALSLGVRVKMVTADQFAIAKETGRRLGLGDHIYPAKVLKDVSELEGKYESLDEMIMDADGFTDVFPEHKYEIMKRLQGLGHPCAMTGGGANDAPALSLANVGIAVEGATDVARGAADIVLTEPGLSTIVHAIKESRIIVQRLGYYSICACAMAIQISLTFTILAFRYKYDFPPFMMLVEPSVEPVSWDLAEVFSFGVFYGLYLTASTVALVAIIPFLRLYLGVRPSYPNLHMFVYFQVANMSQLWISVLCSRRLIFPKPPPRAYVMAGAILMYISFAIAKYGNWGFTQVNALNGLWIALIFLWNGIWLIPLNGLKFAMNATVIKYLRQRRKLKAAQEATTSASITRTQSQTASIHDSMYSNRMSFIKRTARKVGFGAKISMKPEEFEMLGIIQAQRVEQTLAKNPRTEVISSSS
ncbi:plasma membrane H+-transporting ATPase [Phlegmacium glaucopus]|nr:plasma membrane H+-transporting ATPase [Phlegmacium glaucopus]